MKENILNYLNFQRIGVLAVQAIDGSPHACVMHFSHIEDPLQFIMLTSRDSKKCEAIAANGKSKASLVTGANETDMKSFQAVGDIEFTEDPTIMDAYFAKFPEKWDKYSPGGHDAFLIFTPTWWQFTDYKADEGQRITKSE